MASRTLERALEADPTKREGEKELMDIVGDLELNSFTTFLFYQMPFIAPIAANSGRPRNAQKFLRELRIHH